MPYSPSAGLHCGRGTVVLRGQKVRGRCAVSLLNPNLRADTPAKVRPRPQRISRPNLPAAAQAPLQQASLPEENR